MQEVVVPLPVLYALLEHSNLDLHPPPALPVWRGRSASPPTLPLVVCPVQLAQKHRPDHLSVRHAPLDPILLLLFWELVHPVQEEHIRGRMANLTA